MAETSRVCALLTGLLLVACGAAQPLTCPPFGWLGLQLIYVVPPMLILSRMEGRRAWQAGWLYGAAGAMSIFWWLLPTIERFSNLGLAGGAAVLGLFGAVFGFWGAAFGWGAAAVRRASGRLWPLGLAAWFLACEFLNPQLFPYTQGHPWFVVPRVFLLSALTGVTGVSFLVLAVNGLLAAAAEPLLGRQDPAVARDTLRRSGAVFAVIASLGLGYAQVRHAEVRAAMDAGDTLTVALIQNNLDVPALRALTKKDTLGPEKDLVALSKEALVANPDIDVVVWAEGATRASLRSKRRAFIRELATQHGVELWTGIVERRGTKPNRTRHNGAYRVAADGSLSVPYDKNILVPFGEFMPLADTLPFLKTIRRFAPLEAGETPTIVYGSGGPAVGFLVCYEATRFRYVREQAEAGAEMLATVTFDGWFGDTNGLDLHMMIAAANSAMTGLPHVRAATTGVSIATGADSRLLGQTPRAERTWLTVDVPLGRAPAPYVKLGDWVAWLSVLLGFALAVRERRRDLAVPLVFLAMATLTWAIDSYVPVADVLIWVGAGSLVLLGRRPT